MAFPEGDPARAGPGRNGRPDNFPPGGYAALCIAKQN